MDWYWEFELAHPVLFWLLLRLVSATCVALTIACGFGAIIFSACFIKLLVESPGSAIIAFLALVLALFFTVTFGSIAIGICSEML